VPRVVVEIGRTAVTAALLGDRLSSIPKPELRLDIDKLRPIFATGREDFDLGDLVLPAPRGGG